MGKYTHFLYEERKEIFRLKMAGYGIRRIAMKIGRDKSSVSRELKRNMYEGWYLPDSAHNASVKRHTHRTNKIVSNPVLKNYVISKLKEQWSPEQIAGRMRYEEMSCLASTETIYQYIYSSEGVLFKLYNYLYYARKKRRGRYKRASHSNISNRVSIHLRPIQHTDRSIAGNFEGDTTFNHGNKSMNLAVLTERRSRLTLLIKNHSKRSLEVINGIINRLKELGSIPLSSITFDNGSEFAYHRLLAIQLGVKTYFCDPGAPWQKGSVERSIVSLHRFIPKYAFLRHWTSQEIRLVEAKLNNLPRKVLNFRTPIEVFSDSFKSVALHS